MKWRGRRGSRNIEDRRGRGSATGGKIGGIGLVVLLVAGYFLGIDVTPFIGGGNGVGSSSVQTGELTEEDKAAGEFVSVVLADTEVIWDNIFRTQLQKNYRPAKLVLFNSVTQSPCGNASGATGPFYCPADRKAYLDTDFFSTMARRFGAKGDFAAAYVVAHEIAHHVQNELGVLGQANQARSRMSETESNRVSVMIELQADCFSGVWARYAQEKLGSIEPGDLQEALNAAKQIGDDKMQANAGRRPQPHTFTHGSSEQRMRWFATGFESGNINQCDTFSAQQL